MKRRKATVPLSQRREDFARHYARTGRKQRSAILAGYSPRSAAQQACYLLKDPKVLEMVEAERAKRMKALDVDEEWIRQKVAEIAGADRREIVEVVDGRVVIHDSDEWSEESARSVRAIRARVARKRGRPGKNDDAQGDEVIDMAVTMEPRLEALRLLAELGGYLKPRRVDITSGGRPLMRDAPKTVEEAEQILREARGEV